MPFDYQPTLRGSLVELQPLVAEDEEDLYRVAADPRIWEQHPVKNRHERASFEAFFRDSLESGGALVVREIKSGAVIGATRFAGRDEDRSEIEIGWTFLARSHWGGRFNGDLKSIMVTHAFRFVRHVIFLVALDNYRSQRAVEKLGAVRDGRRPDDGGVESHLYRLSAGASRSDADPGAPTA